MEFHMQNNENEMTTLTSDEVVLVSGGLRNNDIDCGDVGVTIVATSPSNPGGAKCDP
jgi:hypothetical protein